MSTLKVNKIRDTAGSADSITLDPNGGAVIAGVTTVSTVKVGSGVTITSDGDIFHTGVCTATSFAGEIPASSIVGVCTSGLTKTGGFGAMLQLKSTTKTDVTSTDSASYVDISGMSVTLTPSAGTKCYVTFHIVAGGATGYGYGIQIVRDSTTIANGDQYGSNNYYACRGGFLTINSTYLHGANMDHAFLDTHGADGSTAVTYKLQWKSPYEQYIYLNRSHAGHTNNSNESNYLSSTITVMEVAA